MTKKLTIIFVFFLTLILGVKSAWAACPAGNLACGKSTDASHTFSSYYPSNNVTDGNYATSWNSGYSPTLRNPQWIRIDLGSSPSYYNRIKLLVSQATAGNTTHNVRVNSDTSSLGSVVYTYSGYTSNGQWLDITLPNSYNYQYLSVETTVGSSWVAWSEIEVYAAPCTPVCSINADCGTNTSCTTYTCNNPGTCTSTCSHVTNTPVCSFDTDCNDNNSCTTDTCLNPGTCTSSCAPTNNPVNGTWGAPYGACIGGTQTMTCNGASCGGICPGSGTQTCTAPIVNNDAGIVQSGGTINSGSGKVSQSGSDPGYRLLNYTSNVDLTSVSYSSLITTVLKNAGTSLSDVQSKSTCDGTTAYALTGSNFDFYCFRNSNFDAILGAAIGGSSKIHVLIPKDSGTTVSQTISSAKTVPNGQRIIVFVNGSLNVNANITTTTTNALSSIIFIMNYSGPLDLGNLTLDPGVARLDGIYIFPGTFNDGLGGTQLTGYGSLLATGLTNLGFNRYYYPGPAEQWFYQPKYLTIYQNILAAPKYTWRELTPQ